MSDADSDLTEQAPPAKFQIFRYAESQTLEEEGLMKTIFEVSPEVNDLITTTLASGFRDGQQVRVLFNVPGFSLAHAWFKRDFPLPLHSHNTDCLYYVVAGTLRLGREDLGKGDGFFVPSGVPYTYTPGPDGVEVLEFRHETHFNLVGYAKSATWWKKALDTSSSRREEWLEAVRP